MEALGLKMEVPGSKLSLHGSQNGGPGLEVEPPWTQSLTKNFKMVFYSAVGLVQLVLHMHFCASGFLEVVFVAEVFHRWFCIGSFAQVIWCK